MQSTPISLLKRLRRPGENEAWNRFAALHTPLLYHWARRLLRRLRQELQGSLE